MNIDQALAFARRDPRTFDARVLQKIAEYKLERPDAFQSPTELARDEEFILLTLITDTYPESQALLNFVHKLKTSSDSKESSGLISKLRWAYKTRSFSDLLYYSYKTDGSLRSTFEIGYRGGCHRLFINVLRGYQQSRWATEPLDRPYCWSIPVVQSSGMGKSRMMDEVSKLIFTIPLNIRERIPEDIHGYQVYPPVDGSVRDFFLEHQMKSDLQLQAEYTILLRVLFDKTVQLLGGNAIFRDLTGEHLASRWAEYLNEGQSGHSVGSNRKAFLDEVVKESHQFYTSGINEAQLNGLTVKLRTSCKELVKAVSSGISDEPACLVYFNEAQILTGPRDDPNETRCNSPYDNLRTVLSEIDSVPIFFAFISTSSRLLRPPQFYTSHRSAIRFKGCYSIPPFIELPFDEFVEDVLGPLKESGQLTLERVCRADVIVGFGRPVWYAHWLYDSQHVFTMARHMLVGIISKGKEFRPRLAALSVRVGLAFDKMTQAARAMESHLVEWHLRVVYAIPEGQEYMLTGTSSEPILANTAAEFLDNPSNGNGIANIGPKILVEAKKQHLLASEGYVGVCGRLLVTAAHDIAVKRYLAKLVVPLPYREPHFHQPVPVLDLLCALFPEKFHRRLMEAPPLTRHPNVCSLQEAFRDSFVSFSHFAVAADVGMLSTGVPGLATALLRGMALQIQNGEYSVDAVIPIHMGPTTAPISAETTSAINLVFKNRKYAEPCRPYRKTTVPNVDMPVLSIVFELGAERAEGDRVEVELIEATIPPDNEKGMHEDDRHYSIIAYGHGPGTFNVVPEAAVADYDAILGSNAIIDHFARADHQGCLQAFHNLKPFFKVDKLV